MRHLLHQPAVAGWHVATRKVRDQSQTALLVGLNESICLTGNAPAEQTPRYCDDNPDDDSASNIRSFHGVPPGSEACPSISSERRLKLPRDAVYDNASCLIRECTTNHSQK